MSDPLPLYTKFRFPVGSDINGTPVELIDLRGDLFKLQDGVSIRARVRIKNASAHAAQVGTEDWFGYEISPGETLELELQFGVRLMAKTASDGNNPELSVLAYRYDNQGHV